MTKHLMATIAIAVATILLLVACGGTVDSSPSTPSLPDVSNVQAEEPITAEELSERALHLFNPHILPDGWWIGAGSIRLDTDEFTEPLAGTREGTTFHRVLRFDSIAEMKRNTEQVVTKEYAETKLYPLEEQHKQFLDRDGKLYINTSSGSGAWPFRAVSATVLWQTADQALLSVVFRGGISDKEESIKEVEMKRENQTWKLNNTPYTSDFIYE